MADTRSQDVIQRLTTLLRDSKVKKGLSSEAIDVELRWILDHLESRHHNGLTIVNLIYILKNCNYGYKNLKGQIAEDTKEIPQDIWEGFLEATTKSLEKIDKSQLLIIFSCFKEMNVWQNADENFKKFREHFLKRLVDPYFRHLDVAQTARTLMNLGYQWSDLTSNIKDIMLDEIEYLLEYKPIDSFNLLWVCAGLGMPADELSKKIKVHIAEEANRLIKQQIKIIKEHPEINLMSRTKWSDATTLLRQIQQIRLYYDLPFDKEHGELLDDQLEACIKIEIKLFEKNYRTFQDSIVGYLKKIASDYGFEIQEEATPLHMKPVDVFIPKKKQIIELNGPHHYNLHGAMRPNDILNQNIFEKNGYPVAFIKQSVWNAQEDKIEFLLNGLQALEIIGPDRIKPKVEVKTEEEEKGVKKEEEKKESFDRAKFSLHSKKQKPENSEKLKKPFHKPQNRKL